jgi:hypothetical protein
VVVVAAVLQEEPLQLKRKKRKKRLKKRKPKLAEAWICSEEVMLVVVVTISRSNQFSLYLLGHGENSRFFVLWVMHRTFYVALFCRIVEFSAAHHYRSHQDADTHGKYTNIVAQ